MFGTSGVKMLDKTIFPQIIKINKPKPGPIVISFIVPKKAINYEKITGLDSGQFLFIRTLGFFFINPSIFIRILVCRRRNVSCGSVIL